MSKRFYSKKSEKLASEALEAYGSGKAETDLHEIRRLEEKLRTDHTDVKTRCTLLGFYSQSTHEQAAAIWCTHAEWIIKTCSDEMLVRWVLQVPDCIAADQFEALKRSFLQKVKRNPKNANVAGHAAYFTWLRDVELTKKLFKRAIRLAPNNYQWSSDLYDFYSYEARLHSDKKLAEKAFRVGEKFIRRFEKKAHHRLQVFLVITRLCELALKIEDLKRLAKYIKELKNAEFDFISPYVKHYYSGLLAVKKGKVERAKLQLLKFANKQGRLDDFRLANQLLELGEFQTVIKYLDTCIKDTRNEQHETRVTQWISQLQKGKKITLNIPNKKVSPLWDY